MIKLFQWSAVCLLGACLICFTGCGGDSYENPDVHVVTDDDIRDFPDDDDDLDGGSDPAALVPDD